MKLGRVTFKLPDKIYTSKILKKGLDFASSNGSLFAAGTSLVLSSTVRPLAILATPKTDSENKKLACAKSLSSTLTGYLLMLIASNPIAKAVKKIDKSPEKYLDKSALKIYKTTKNSTVKSKSYQFATQLFKLGTGLMLAIPKSIIVCAITPIILSKLFKTENKSQLENIPFKGKNIPFEGQKIMDLAPEIGKIMNKKPFQNFVNHFKDSNFAMHITALTDILTTFTFVHQTKKSEKISPERKSPLIYNSLISTGLSVTGGYILDKALDKPTEKFIKKFRKLNQNDAKLEKYVEGIKIAKPVLILGGIYYAVIPLISTFIADRASANNKKL